VDKVEGGTTPLVHLIHRRWKGVTACPANPPLHLIHLSSQLVHYVYPLRGYESWDNTLSTEGGQCVTAKLYPLRGYKQVERWIRWKAGELTPCPPNPPKVLPAELAQGGKGVSQLVQLRWKAGKTRWTVCNS
jgi:hypothetical protein